MIKKEGRERKRKKNWTFHVNELPLFDPLFDQGGTTASFPSTLLFYWSSGKEAAIIFVVLQANRKRNASTPLFISNSRAPYMTCAVKLQTF